MIWELVKQEVVGLCVCVDITGIQCKREGRGLKRVSIVANLKVILGGGGEILSRVHVSPSPPIPPPPYSPPPLALSTHHVCNNYVLLFPQDSGAICTQIGLCNSTNLRKPQLKKMVIS